MFKNLIYCSFRIKYFINIKAHSLKMFGLQRVLTAEYFIIIKYMCFRQLDAGTWNFPQEYRNAYEKGASKGNCEENVSLCRQAIDSGQEVEAL